MTDIELKLHYCPVIQAIILVCGTILCYIVAYSRGDVSLYLPFISETGAYSPEKCIFSLSLNYWEFPCYATSHLVYGHLGYMLVSSSSPCSIIIFYYYIVIRQSHLNEGRFFSYLNVGSLFIGTLSMLGLAGVAAFPMTTVFWAHLLFAAMYFVGSGVYFILISFITYKVEGVSKKCILRSTLSICIMIFLFLIVILFPLSLVRWHENNDFIPALKTPENKGFTLLLLSSVLEWSIVIVILLFTLSLIYDLNKYSFQIMVTEPCKSPSVVEGPTTSQD